MRAVADVLRENGIYSLSLRMPGHGTAPSGLVRATWQDWLAAVRMGVRHVRASIPRDAPLILVGYSNGGALVLKYTLDAIEREGEPRPAKLILLSPMIGVTPGREAGVVDQPPRRGPVLRESELARRDPRIQPIQVQLVSRERRVSDGVDDARRAGRPRPGWRRAAGSTSMPPILTFQSIVDATVSTPAVVHLLYDRLPSNGSELVLFDVNHLSGIDVFMQPADQSLVDRSVRSAAALVSSRARDQRVGRDPRRGRADDSNRTPTSRRGGLGLAWPPRGVLAHARRHPVPPDDPLYGIEGRRGTPGCFPSASQSARRARRADRRHRHADAALLEPVLSVRGRADQRVGRRPTRSELTLRTSEGLKA